MRKIFCVFSFALVVFFVYAQQEHISVGFRTGIAADHEAPTIGVDIRYNIFKDVRIAPSITHMIRYKNQSAWYFDFEGHYVFDISNAFSFYPIGGVSLSIWDFHSRFSDKITHTRLGLNVGLGGEIKIIYQLSVGLDMKYNVIRDYHQALAAVRVAYHF